MQRMRTGKAFAVFVLVLLLWASPLAVSAHEEGGEVIAEGFNSPQGVLVDPEGNVWVIDSGTGGDTQLEITNPEDGQKAVAQMGISTRVVKITGDGTQTEVAKLPSTLIGQSATGGARLALLNGELYATVGAWQESEPEVPGPNMATVVKIGADGTVAEVAKPWDLEKQNNPDGFLVGTHPYGLAAAPGNRLYVTDAHGNMLLSINPNTGRVGVVTVFAGIPSPLENPNRGGAQEADPVPTGVTFDADNNVYVSLLTGFPFTQGVAKVMKISADGATVSDYATGLTSLTDLRTGPDGNMYAVQFAKFGAQGPAPHTGAILRIKEGTASEIVAEELDYPTSIDFNADGDAYVTINGVGAPGTGAVLKLAGLTTATGTPVPQPGTPAVAVADQASDGTSVTVDSVVAVQPGWMVIHSDDGDKPGPVLGQTQVISGVNYAVTVSLDPPLAGDSKLWAMLHVDEGEAGVYEFPGADGPVIISDTVVMTPLMAEVTAAAEGAAPAAGETMTETHTMTATQAMTETYAVTDTEGLSTTVMVDPPSVTADDQGSDGATVSVGQVTAAVPGWMVIHLDDNGKPGPVLGQTLLAAGTTENVVVELAEALATDTKLWAMLHVDEGIAGEYEFPGADGPVIIDGKVVMAPFTALVAGSAPAPAADQAPEKLPVTGTDQAGTFNTVLPGLALLLVLAATAFWQVRRRHA